MESAIQLWGPKATRILNGLQQSVKSFTISAVAAHEYEANLDPRDLVFKAICHGSNKNMVPVHFPLLWDRHDEFQDIADEDWIKTIHFSLVLQSSEIPPS